MKNLFGLTIALGLLFSLKTNAQEILTDLVAVSQSGNTISSSGANGWGSSGFSTVNSFSADGHISFRAVGTNGYLMVGLSSSNANANYNTIGYAIYLRNNVLYVYENGSGRGTFGNYQAGDTFRAERNGTTVTYLKNNTVFYTSTVPSTGSLLGDAAFYHNGLSISDLGLVDASAVSGNSEPITDLVAVSQSGNTISSSGANGWGSSGFSTVNSFSADGHIAFRAVGTNGYLMVGLSSSNANANYNTIGYAIYLRNNALYVYENGSGRGTFGNYQAGDTFRAERNGTTVTYLKNNTVFYTSTVPSTGSLLGDAAFYHNGLSISDLSLVDASASTGGGSLWSINGNTAYYNTGNVAIGRTNVPNGYALAVDGHIRTREVRVDQDTWPDYVFKEDYSLPTLEEAEKHINEKGHLINIPSAKEVKANGIELGEMNMKLLEKIEELTLYIINQEKRMIIQEQRILQLEKIKK